MRKTFLGAMTICLFNTVTIFSNIPGTTDGEKRLNAKKTVSEEDDKKFNIGLSAGTTIPLQDYASTTNSNDSTQVSGYAQTGVHFNATASYKIIKYLGAMVMVGGNINSCNPSSSSSAGAAITPSGSHYVGQYLAGPYVSVPVGKKFSVEVRALVGLITAAYPKLSESTSASLGTYYSYSITTELAFKHGAAFGYSAGLGGKYMLGEHFGLMLNAAYSGSSMNFPGSTFHIEQKSSGLFSTTVPINTNTTTTRTNTTHMSIGMINISVGIAYGF